jgi:thiamine-phosphate pyrophosphorylase
MAYEFTPASERALEAAAAWTSSSDIDALGVPEVLLGLLAEPECRAALLLAQCDVDPAAVHRRFPTLARLEPPRLERTGQFSKELTGCLKMVESLLLDYPRPLFLATEHVLLGIVAAKNEASLWLEDCGLRADALEAQVHRLSGHQPGPLPLDTGAEENDDASAAENKWPGEEPAPSEILPGSPAAPHEQLAALRIIDAAANRAGEGLRVIEDYLRFTLDDGHLTKTCKSIRHDLTAALDVFSSTQRHAARETQADVGTTVSLPAETVRNDATAVVMANFKRAQQSLRSLEEFAKTLAPERAAALEQLRYRLYTLERAVDLTRSSLERLGEARLYVLVDGCATAGDLRHLVETLVAAGVAIVQLREKKLSDRELLARARLVAEATRGSHTLFMMNDRADLALLSGADGVHVGQDEVTVKDARRILGPTGLVGVSTHSLEQARAAVLDGASYIGVGPTFPSGTKDFAKFTGTELLQAVHGEIQLPAFAIGGITSENLQEVLATGFRRIAVSGAITRASDPGAAARELLAALAN